MLQTRSSILLVAQVNTVAGGSVVVITNSSNIFITNTNLTVVVQNSGGLFAMQSGNWNVGLNAGTALIGTMNVVAQGTGGSVNVINSAGWVVSASSTIMNSSRLATTYDCAYAMDGTAQVVMRYSTINILNSTNTVLVNALTDVRIKVMSMFLMSYSTGTFFLQSGSTSPVSLTGPIPLAANVGFVLPFNPNGWFQTGVATLLNGSMSSATTIGGCITYLATS